ncbi:hypothetical protein ACP70R_034168 [Stipagrostis hirtigluma subsp. patula]
MAATATTILDTHNIAERDHEPEKNCRDAYPGSGLCPSGEGDLSTPLKGSVLDGRSSRIFAEVTQPKLWYGDGTILTPKQEEAALGLSNACTSGIPVYICSMKKSNIIKRQMAFSREFSRRYIFPRLGTYGCETRVFAGRDLTGSKLNFSMIHGELRLLGGWPLFVKNNRIEAGHMCAFMFEEEDDEEKEGVLLSLRVHVLGSAPTI